MRRPLPFISLLQTSLVRVTAAGPTAPDFTNKATVVGLGLVVKREEVVSAVDDGLSNLHVTIQHCDWDSVQRSHKTFTVLYVVPGTKIFVKTHGLYVVGREVEVTGQLVDFDMDSYSAIVSVNSVSVTTGHQIGRLSSTHTPSPSGSKNGRTFFTPNKPKQGPSHPSVDPAKDTFTNDISDTEMTPVDLPSSERNGKGKERSNPGGNDSDLYDSDSPIVNRSSSPSSKVRPRASVLQGAAKRLKTS
ncbi:hypothetical protein PSTT_14781 [Puccinia striiformis]|uniref:Uncharacterized protein n=1 Tax=Puccinia striiformis TaxID=27350 RepID=A0A2S4UKN4_9BASI|nr:hypothetical protein PSTT_14781 [Puccinia striiformis]